MHLRRQVAMLDGNTITLTPMQYQVLVLLVEHAGEVVPRATFLRQIWGHKPELSPNRVDVHLHGVRRRLGVYADQYIETVFGIGYVSGPCQSFRVRGAFHCVGTDCAGSSRGGRLCCGARDRIL